MQKPDVKMNVLPHTEAKLKLFEGYLEHYLRVLSQTDFCKQINLFDIYCGAGEYDDGKKGSPLIAIDCVRRIRSEMIAKAKAMKPISLLVNDYDSERVENVKSKADTNDIENFSIDYQNKNANEMLDIIAGRISKYSDGHKNLVFIDPYGYSDINKDKFISLLDNKNTEIILFLPVDQMYRFIKTAFTRKEEPQYEALRKFIISFFNTPDIIEGKTELEFIHAIKEVLSVNNSYFTCSHYIERKKGNYYALFFISSNALGLEKMLETKWKLDPGKGKGFNHNKNPMQMSMFGEEMDRIDNLREISYLENIIYKFVKQNNTTTNVELYKLTLRNEFLPKHAKEALDNLIAQNRIRKINNSDGYNINYSNFKNGFVSSKFEAL